MFGRRKKAVPEPAEGAAGIHTAPAFQRGGDVTNLENFRAAVADDGAMRLFDYWTGLVAEHGLAIKAMVDPVAVPDLLPRIYIEEWDAELGQSRMRLTGEFLRDLAGVNLLGLPVEKHAAPEALAVWQECDRLNFTEQRATLSYYSLAHFEKDHRWVWDLSLPMSDENGARFTLGYVWNAG